MNHPSLMAFGGLLGFVGALSFDNPIGRVGRILGFDLRPSAMYGPQ